MLPNPSAIVGRSAIMKAFVGHAALQPAIGPPPLTTGEKKSSGKADVQKESAHPASSSRSGVPASRPSGKAKMT